MSMSRNKVEDSSTKTSKKGKLKKVFPFVAGNTKECHEKILKKLKETGAKVVNKGETYKAALVFCPIVSRLDADISSALSDFTPESKEGAKVILVAMHHTYNTEYTVPLKVECNYNGKSIPVVHCLFHETKGLLKCPTNNQAIKTIRKELGLKTHKGTPTCVNL